MGTATVKQVWDKVTGEAYAVVRFIDGGCGDDFYEVEDGCFSTKKVNANSVTLEAPAPPTPPTPPAPVFEIGQHVKLVVAYDNSANLYDAVPEVGSVGIVRKTTDEDDKFDPIGVEWIGFSEGGNLLGALDYPNDERGWWVPATSLEKI